MEKYSNKFINQINKLRDAKVGMEFEFYIKDLSYYKALELLNKEFEPVKFWGFRQYHSNFKPDEYNFKMEPDLSGGSNMIEIITGPLNYLDAKYYLVKIINFIQNYGYTNDKCSIHFNISFDDEKLNLNNLNVLKLILNIDEDEIYNYYPSRKNNVYSKSIKKIIPYKEYDFFNISIETIKNNIRLPMDKYYGVNFMNINSNKESQRLEFRYIGGKGYEKNIGHLIYFLERFIILTFDCISLGFNSEDSNNLENYLEYNINRYRILSNYDNFILDFPTIVMQIDQNSTYEVVSFYYGKIYNKISRILDSVEYLNDCIINYVTSTQTIEIVDAQIKGLGIIDDIEFINCDLEGVFEDCFFVSSKLNNSQITKCKLKFSEAINSKVYNSNIDSSTLENCFFMDGYLNGEMIGGVYRSGKLGPNAILDSSVKIVKDYDNFFDIKYDSDSEKQGINKYKKFYKK